MGRGEMPADLKEEGRRKIDQLMTPSDVQGFLSVGEDVFVILVTMFSAFSLLEMLGMDTISPVLGFLLTWSSWQPSILLFTSHARPGHAAGGPWSSPPPWLAGPS